MPLYLIVSEMLYKTIPILDDGSGPLEPYRIVKLVVAQSREQARYLAWQTDKHSTNDLSEMPNFRTRKLQNSHSGIYVIPSDLESYYKYWSYPKSIDLLNQEF